MTALFRAIARMEQHSAPVPMLFPAAPKLPKPPDPVPMPDLGDPAILAARRRALEVATRSGRASTMLSSGAGDYSGDKLGTA